MGGGAIVDGVLRWFQRRSHKPYHSEQSLSYDNRPQREESEEAEGDLQEKDLQIVFDLDISGLKPIRVPKRNKMAAVDPHKKVLSLDQISSLLLAFSLPTRADCDSLCVLGLSDRFFISFLSFFFKFTCLVLGFFWKL